jgi:hypothetical protein
VFMLLQIRSRSISSFQSPLGCRVSSVYTQRSVCDMVEVYGVVYDDRYKRMKDWATNVVVVCNNTEEM